MNKIVSSILGWLILVGSGVLFVIIGNELKFNDPELVLLCCGLIAGMGLAYTVMHQEKYPIKVVSIVFISQLLFLIIFGRDSWGIVLTESTADLIIPGVIFTLLGPRLGQAINFILSPIQKYLQSIGLKVSTHVVAGIMGFTLACIKFTQ